jgi:hypothetical protein
VRSVLYGLEQREGAAGIASVSAYYVKHASGRLVSGKSTPIAAQIAAKANAKSRPRPDSINIGDPGEGNVVSSAPAAMLPTASH